MDPTPARAEPIALPVFVAFAVALATRVAMILALPFNFSFDGFQRWAGREHLLVQAWLPLAQSVITGVSALGGDVREARLAMAFVAACATAAGGWLAGRIGGRVAAWAWIVPATFGPFLVWGSTLYQEGTFLLVLFTGLGLAHTGRLRAADLVVGSLALVRYEGWPCVLLYIAWRRDPRALLALWGAALWLLLKAGVGVHGYAASPVDFDDWEGLRARTTVASWIEDAVRLFLKAWAGGAVAFAVAAAVGLRVAWNRRLVPLLAAIGLLQAAAVSGWLAGLETATQRMLVVPTVIAGLLGAVAAGVLWPRFPRWARAGLVVGGLVLVYVGTDDAWRALRAESARNAPERALAARLAARPDCDWRITPRRNLGTRARHDGCETVQGQGLPRHGDGFWCTTWGPAPAPARACVAEAVWDGERYTVTFSGE